MAQTPPKFLPTTTAALTHIAVSMTTSASKFPVSVRAVTSLKAPPSLESGPLAALTVLSLAMGRPSVTKALKMASAITSFALVVKAPLVSSPAPTLSSFIYQIKGVSSSRPNLAFGDFTKRLYFQS